ncbi:MAG TPA: hypothetical protein VGJ04_05310 [Pirellulales bacterium]
MNIPIHSPLAALSKSPGELAAFVGVMLTAVLIALSVMATLGALRRARETTLLAPLIWTLISLSALTAALIAHTNAASHAGVGTSDKFWLLAVCSTFCPLMSLLGAKRPQNRAWQFIVFSFWIVAALPTISALILQPADPLEVPTLWRWFYAALLLLFGVNYLPTRFGPASLLATIGEAQLLWPYLPLTSFADSPSFSRGITLLGAGICVAWATSRIRFAQRRDWRNSAAPLPAWTNVWLAFRDMYGLVWGARMLERIESLLQSSNVAAWLQWNGFHSPSLDANSTDHHPLRSLQPSSSIITEPQQPASLPAAMAAVEPGVRNLLRRFVSNNWIDQRLNRPPQSSDPN